jgi:hypothetical protein
VWAGIWQKYQYVLRLCEEGPKRVPLVQPRAPVPASLWLLLFQLMPQNWEDEGEGKSQVIGFQNKVDR